MKNWETWRRCSIVLCLLVIVLSGFLISKASNCDNCEAHASFWTGIDYPQGGWLGLETYLTGVFDSPNIAIEFNATRNVFDQVDQSVSMGLRGVFTRYSLGVGYGINDYPDILLFHPKVYFWSSTYNEYLYAKAYFETDCHFPRGFLKTSASLDCRTRPIGIALSYLFNESPPGTYEEIRGDVSLFLFYPCLYCWKSSYDCDLRLYVGGRGYRFTSPEYKGIWRGFLGGIRLYSIFGEIRVEGQKLFKEDAYSTPSWEWRILFSDSLSF